MITLCLIRLDKSIRGVAMLEDGLLEFVNIYFTIGSCIVGNQSFHRFNPYFCSAVAEWEGYCAQEMMYTPLEEEGTCDWDTKLQFSIG